MKFCSVFLAAACLSLINAFPHPKPDEVADSDPNDSKPLLSCLAEKHQLEIQFCENKFKIDNNTSSISSRKKRSAELLLASTSEEVDAIFDNLEMQSLCMLREAGVIDEVSSQLELSKLTTIYIEDTSLSAEQKSSASASVKDCVMEDIVKSTSSLFVYAPDVKIDAAKESQVTANHITICVGISLLQHGCSDPSFDKAKVASILKDYFALKDLERELESSSEE